MKAHSVKYILLCLLSERENISYKDYKELFSDMERDQNDEINKTLITTSDSASAFGWNK